MARRQRRVTGLDRAVDQRRNAALDIQVFFRANDGSLHILVDGKKKTLVDWVPEFDRPCTRDRCILKPRWKRASDTRSDRVFRERLCAFQDTAISGLAVDLVPENERARANGFILAGEAVGTAIGTITSGVLIAQMGIAAAFYGMALFVGLSLSLLLFVRERPGERLLPWTTGQISIEAREAVAGSWRKLFDEIWRVMSKAESLLLAMALGLYGFAYGLYAVIGPVIATQFGGWSDEGFATLNGVASLIAGLLGMVAFGWLVDRIGARLGSTIGMFLYALVGLSLIAMAPFWQMKLVLAGVVFLAFASDVLMRIGAYATAMGLCDVKGAATQFSLFLACANVGTILSGLVIGRLEHMGGETPILLVASSAALCATFALWIIRDGRMVQTRRTVKSDPIASETA